MNSISGSVPGSTGRAAPLIERSRSWTIGLFVRHQLTLTAHQPAFDAETQRLGRLRYDQFVKIVGQMLARPDAEPPVEHVNPGKGG